MIARNRVIRQFVHTSPAARESILLDEIRAHVERLAPTGVPVLVDLPASGHAVTFLDTPRSVQRMLRVGPVADTAARAEALLGDARRCEVVVVALPEELPVNETIELVRRARAIGVATRHVVVNQVPPALLGPEERALLDVIRQHAPGAMGRFAERAHGDSHGADQARAQIERLRAAVPVCLHEIPRYELAEPRRCVEAVIEELARELGA
jgi:anion-transporting  ArsA/GET3 family ATPase